MCGRANHRHDQPGVLHAQYANEPALRCAEQHLPYAHRPRRCLPLCNRGYPGALVSLAAYAVLQAFFWRGLLHNIMHLHRLIWHGIRCVRFITSLVDHMMQGAMRPTLLLSHVQPYFPPARMSCPRATTCSRCWTAGCPRRRNGLASSRPGVSSTCIRMRFMSFACLAQSGSQALHAG